jgi:hypothetical protein
MSKGEKLLLGGHLRVRVAPGAELQAAAHPTQPFRGARSAFASAHDTLLRLFETVQFNRAPRLLQNNLGDDRSLGDARLRLRAFPFHILTITAASSVANTERRPSARPSLQSVQRPGVVP